MRTLFVVNDAADLDPNQTTTLLIARAQTRGHQVWVASVADLWMSPSDEPLARAASVDTHGSLQALCAQIAHDRARDPLTMGDLDLIWVRTNPARDAPRRWAHEASLSLLEAARDEGGACVINDPTGLRRASSKLYLSDISDEFKPRTLVAHRLDVLREFIDSIQGPCVCKPLMGTHGQDVFRLGPRDQRENVLQILDVLRRQGHVMVQEFVPQAVDGDVRILVVEGALFEHQGEFAAVKRVPGKGDFRSNVHAGGKAAPAQIDETMRRAVEAIGPVLRRDGIFLAGLDFIGGKIIEINAYSPGGFGDCQAFYGGIDFASACVARAEALTTKS